MAKTRKRYYVGQSQTLKRLYYQAEPPDPNEWATVLGPFQTRAGALVAMTPWEEYETVAEAEAAARAKPETVVCFRMEGRGETSNVLAVFPEIPHDRTGELCVCYAHVGQHGACRWDYARRLKPATPAQYRELKRELELRGYVKLRVVEKPTRGMHKRRRDEAARVRERGEPGFVETVESYKQALLWSSVDFKGNPMDERFSSEDFAPEAVETIERDVLRFLIANKEDLIGIPWRRIGFCLALSRNHHGSGFFDEETIVDSNLRNRLQDAAEKMGEVRVVEGDDGNLYIE